MKQKQAQKHEDIKALELAQRLGSSAVESLVTRRQAAGKAATEALEELAAALRDDGKAYGAGQVDKMAAEAAQWSRAL